MKVFEVDEVPPSGTMCQNKRMRMSRALVEMRDGSDVYMGEPPQCPRRNSHHSLLRACKVSEVEGGAGIRTPHASTDVEASHEVVLEAMGDVCSLYDVELKMWWTVMRTTRGRFSWGT